MKNNSVKFGEFFIFLVKLKAFTYQKSREIQIYKAAALVALVTADI